MAEQMLVVWFSVLKTGSIQAQEVKVMCNAGADVADAIGLLATKYGRSVRCYNIVICCFDCS